MPYFQTNTSIDIYSEMVFFEASQNWGATSLQETGCFFPITDGEFPGSIFTKPLAW